MADGGIGFYWRVSGVEPGERDKIFERFYRTVRSDRVPGIGLGLSIAAAIANLHDFDLRVEDNNPGALFVMSAREAPPARRKDSALNQAPTRALINLQTRPE